MITADRLATRPRFDPMAKKKPATPKSPLIPKTHPSEVRFQMVHVDEIQTLVDDAKQWLAEIEGTLKISKERKIESFVIDGSTKLTRAVELLEGFAAYIYRGANKALGEQRRQVRLSPEDHQND